MSEDNVVEFTGEWQGDQTAMADLLRDSDPDSLGRTIAGVLEFLTMRAIMDKGYYILTDDAKAITVFAANEDADALRQVIPTDFKSWDDAIDEPEDEVAPFLTGRDPGDEQDESATESE